MNHRTTTPRRRTARTAIAAGTTALVLLLGAPAASASNGKAPVKNTPDPFENPERASCQGNLNATFNHFSGIQDHGKDSKGPGFYFRDGRVFQEVRADVWVDICGPGAGVG